MVRGAQGRALQLRGLALDREHLDLEKKASIWGNAPGREASLAVALFGRYVELADLADGRAEEALVPARDYLSGNQPVS